MPYDLDPWQLLAADAQEFSAFRIWATALEAAGTPVVLLGSPEQQEKRYQELYGLAPGVLTADAHVSLAGEPWFVDHTRLPAPGGRRVPAAIRAAREALRRELAAAALISPTGGLRITVTPQTQSSRRERRRYFERLAAFGRQAAETGQPVYDPEAPTTIPTSPSRSQNPGGRMTRPNPWRSLFPSPRTPCPGGRRTRRRAGKHDTGRLREIADALVKKLTEHKGKTNKPGQLRRAHRLGVPTGLLIDARTGWQPPGLVPQQTAATTHPLMADLPVPLAQDLMSELAAQHPDALTCAWLLSSDEQVHEVYRHEV
ncbi:hypothetical protein [Streptomyces violens]|uniref:hypothetical protein n=1 Tax=Streptomyces violens TaxID=66377 RepID=UPI0004BFC989|nr:hypothetical protein [Streptomyces violens]